MYKAPSIGNKSFSPRPTIICLAAYVYGGTHITTYDGVRYSFHGKGYYILSMMKSPRHDLMIQARLEQPPPTVCKIV